MGRRYRNGWWLEVKYHDEGLTQREIAEECDVSPSCVRDYMREFGIQTREVSGEAHGLYGQERDEETKRKISATMSGREFSDEHRRQITAANEGRVLSEQQKQKISESLRGIKRSEQTRRKMSESTAGEANPNWQGGISFRYGSHWNEARRKVRDRDQVCRHCGHDGSERRLEVHHIVPVRRFKRAEDADVSDAHELCNLVLLCRRDHVRAEHGHISFQSGLEDPVSSGDE